MLRCHASMTQWNRAMTPVAFEGEQPLAQLPNSLRTLAMLERFHLHLPEMFQRTSRDPSFDTRFFPQHCGVFQLPCFWVPSASLYLFGGRQQSDELSLFRETPARAEAMFAVHPASLGHFKQFFDRVGARDVTDDSSRIWAVPTSSTRTLLVWPDGAPEKVLFIKTTLYSPIFGDRRLRTTDVARSTSLSALMEELRSSLPSSLDYLPERVGVVPRCMQDGGMIARSIPRMLKSDEILAVPLFALFGGGPVRTPLLLTILQNRGCEPLRFVEDAICAPFSRMWLHMWLKCGLLLEAHSQDLLIAFSTDLVPLQRFYYRDFEGVQVDWELRRSLGLSTPAELPRAWCWEESDRPTVAYGYSNWFLLYTSLFHFVDAVVRQAELSLMEWRKLGLVSGPRVREGDVTGVFSSHMNAAVEEMFGAKWRPRYDACASPNKFVQELMRLRAELVSPSRSRSTQARPRVGLI